MPSTKPLPCLCRQLAEAAKAGNYEAAENCVEAIKEAGFELTAQTYHGLIFSYAKAGITEAAVRNFYLSLEQGTVAFDSLCGLLNGIQTVHNATSCFLPAQEIQH